MLPYVEDLSQAMVDLLQIENVPLRERKPKSEEEHMTGRLRSKMQSRNKTP